MWHCACSCACLLCGFILPPGAEVRARPLHSALQCWAAPTHTTAMRGNHQPTPHTAMRGDHQPTPHTAMGGDHQPTPHTAMDIWRMASSHPRHSQPHLIEVRVPRPRRAGRRHAKVFLADQAPHQAVPRQHLRRGARTRGWGWVGAGLAAQPNRARACAQPSCARARQSYLVIPSPDPNPCPHPSAPGLPIPAGPPPASRHPNLHPALTPQSARCASVWRATACRACTVRVAGSRTLSPYSRASSREGRCERSAMLKGHCSDATGTPAWITERMALRTCGCGGVGGWAGCAWPVPLLSRQHRLDKISFSRPVCLKGARSGKRRQYTLKCAG